MDNFHREKIQDKPQNYFFDALKEYIYKGEEARGNLKPGHYILKKMSLNSDFKGYIVVIRMWVFEDKNAFGEKVLSYKTINAYDQKGD